MTDEMTELFIVRACRPLNPKIRMDAVVEAVSESKAYELWRDEMGFYDHQQHEDGFPDWKDVEIIVMPRLTGEPRCYTGYEF